MTNSNLTSRTALNVGVILVQIWHNTTHDKKVFTNGTFCDIIKAVRYLIDKLEFDEEHDYESYWYKDLSNT